MKYYSLLITIFCTQFCISQDIPEALKQYKTGISVEHSKDTVYAELYNGTKPNRKKYIWRYETSVKSDSEVLKIVEFGAFYKTNGNWNSTTIYNRPFNTNEFSKWYSCKNGILKPGQRYTDQNNWTTSDTLDGKTKTGIWYYIGTDANGKTYVGYKAYTLMGALQKE